MKVMRRCDRVRARAAAAETLSGPSAAGERLHAQAWPHLSPQKGLDDTLFALAPGTAVQSEQVERLERTSLEPLVRALQALRCVELVVAVTFATEVGDKPF